MKFLKNDPTLKKRRQGLRRNQTDTEKILWLQLRNRKFYGIKFFRQYSVGPYILDFYSPALKLAIELDGGQHNLRENKEYDAVRSKFMRERSIDLIRFWDNEVLLNMEGVLEQLATKVTPANTKVTPPTSP